ncbi:ribose-5-phosphate isomerase [Filimonas lacunae]|uniref:Ribose 5-phosphate isomerase A n=1 Tax=Filimonas lacunae TaxID=477680 RepID=A0A173MDC1_9BACT|nr:ribose 5-phosphate isomerase A [Filimonas lacunae]BAV05479.1 ribose 5-phosphate isomerase A [Filimonas lacunae]SIT20837.1 ribose-5-phosphate isomerase [Filimonas lacunae]
MTKDVRKIAAQAACEWIQKGMTVGLGAGTTIAYLVEFLAVDRELAESLVFLSASAGTTRLLIDNALRVDDTAHHDQVDVYFDGCDQLDQRLYAWKSGGGIHTDEKILASMATDFILLADDSKLVDVLTLHFPLVLEVLPAAQQKVKSTIGKMFPGVELTFRLTAEGAPVLTARNNVLLEARFPVLPGLDELDRLKMLPGVVDHSLFYKMASKAIVASYGDVKVLQASRF